MKSIIVTAKSPIGEIGLKDYFTDCENKNYRAWGMNLFQFKASEKVANKYLITENYPDRIVVSIKSNNGFVYIDLDKIKLNVLKLLKEAYNVQDFDINIEVLDD